MDFSNAYGVYRYAMIKKPNRKVKALNLYANLSARRRTKVDARARRKAEYLATLPKQPLKRLLYRLHPKRVFKFWFSKQGLITFLKLAGVGIVILAIFIAALFAYYRRELDAFSPSQIAKQVQTTVTRYTDRNDVLLWEDKGEDNYKVVIDSKDIAKVMKDATIAIEDKEFYKHAGISLNGMLRAGLSNASGGEIQGASTLTQQLIKQVFFAKDAENNRLSISRKLKEIILAIEVERMYNKDQILTLYLNEVPYGGRRNGVESASVTYFGKHASELSVAEASLIASIPQNPSYYNPYRLTSASTKALLARQHLVIDNMAEQGNITKDQAEEAKKIPILDTIKPEIAADENIKAYHFVHEVRDQLEAEFGTKVIREGGLTVKTTLDWRIQQTAEDSINKNFKYSTSIGGNNMGLVAVDVPTGQILSMVGSHDYKDPGIGNVNITTAPLSPGSSIKPFIYANLFKQQPGQNYGAGSILADENIDGIYKGKLQNYDGRFQGAITIRQALGNSRNPPAVKAYLIGGQENALKTAQEAGELEYCKDASQCGLSAAIGSGVTNIVDHTEAFATLARQGVYKPKTYVLEVKNAQGQQLKQWKDESKKVLDPQITYILADILTDANARVPALSRTTGDVKGVKTATKTGTTDDGAGHAKDSWMMSYSPRMAVGMWTGRNDPKPLTALVSPGNGNVVNDVMRAAHIDIFEKDGSWKPNDWFQRPAGIQTLTVNGKTDIFPSWYKKPANAEGKDVAFDKVSRKKATACTPERAKINVKVQSFTDDATKKTTTTAADGYDANADDDVHKCEDVKPFVSLSSTQVGLPTSRKYRITATVNQGTHPLSSIEISADGQVILTQAASGNGSSYSVDYEFTSPGSKTITATVIDQAMYDGTTSKSQTVATTRDKPRGNGGIVGVTRSAHSWNSGTF